jgi:hypothetical protein
VQNPLGQSARLVRETDGRLVLTGEGALTDLAVRDLIDAGRK